MAFKHNHLFNSPSINSFNIRIMSQKSSQTKHSSYLFGEFGQYLLVSCGVGLATIACRELLGLAVPEQRGLWYAITVGGAYLFGIVLNFFCQSKFTFNNTAKRSRRTFLRFSGVAIISAVLTMWCSTTILPAFLELNWLVVYAPSIAFACGTFIVSPFSFHLSAKWVFE